MSLTITATSSQVADEAITAVIGTSGTSTEGTDYATVANITIAAGSTTGTLTFTSGATGGDVAQTLASFVTSGAGNLFKAGIPVGKITKITERSLNGKVQFFSDFSQLRFIEVLSFEQKGIE